MACYSILPALDSGLTFPMHQSKKKQQQMKKGKKKRTVSHSWDCQTLGCSACTILSSLCLASSYPLISTQKGPALWIYKAVPIKALWTQHIRIPTLHSNQPISSVSFKYILANPMSICLGSVILMNTFLCAAFCKSHLLTSLCRRPCLGLSEESWRRGKVGTPFLLVVLSICRRLHKSKLQLLPVDCLLSPSSWQHLVPTASMVAPNKILGICRNVS